MVAAVAPIPIKVSGPIAGGNRPDMANSTISATTPQDQRKPMVTPSMPAAFQEMVENP